MFRQLTREDWVAQCYLPNSMHMMPFWPNGKLTFVQLNIIRAVIQMQTLLTFVAMMVLIFSAASVKRIRLPNMLNSMVWPGLVSSLWVHSKNVLFIRCFVAVTKRSSSNGAHEWTRGAKPPRALICLFLDTDLTNDEMTMNTIRHGARTRKSDFFSCEMEAIEGNFSQRLPVAMISESDVE